MSRGIIKIAAITIAVALLFVATLNLFSEIDFVPIGWEHVGLKYSAWKVSLFRNVPPDYPAPDSIRIRAFTREFDRLSSTNATLSLYGLGNDIVWLSHYGDQEQYWRQTIGIFASGRDNNITISVDPIYADSDSVNYYNVNLERNSIHVYFSDSSTIYVPLEFNAILATYLKKYKAGISPVPDGNNFTWRPGDLANSIMQRISQNDYTANPGFLGYFFHCEPLNNSNTSEANHDSIRNYTRNTVQNIINVIREYDTGRPVVLFLSNYAGTYFQYDDYSADSTEFDQIFYSTEPNGFPAIRNWNVIVDLWAELTKYSSDADSVNIYIAKTWKLQDISACNLSRKIQRYASYPHDGPEPEWWRNIFICREFVSYNENDPFSLLYRRPTNYEYRSMAYSAIAGGAKGITAYSYGTSNKFYNTRGFDDSVGCATPEIELRIDELDQNSDKIYYPEGVISNAWISSSHDDNPDSTCEHNGQTLQRFELYRHPLSADFGVHHPAHDNTAVLWESDRYEQYGISYPYDEMSRLFLNLRRLLPIIRDDLRWWWVADCIDTTSGNGGVHKSLHYIMHDMNFTSLFPENYEEDGLRLGDYFALDSVKLDSSENHYYRDENGVYYSPIIVGLFDAPLSDGASDYYLFVNKRAWVKNQNNMKFDADPLLVYAYFTVDPELTDTLEVVWKGDRNSHIEDSLNGSLLIAELSLEAGDAILLRLPTASAWTEDIEEATTWSGEIRLQNDISISGNAKLTIMPGAKIISSSHHLITVYGELYSVGNGDNRIQYDSTSILLHQNSSSSSMIQYCEFTDYGLTIHTNLDFPIYNVIFNGCVCGIESEDSEELSIKNCIFNYGNQSNYTFAIINFRTPIRVPSAVLG